MPSGFQPALEQINLRGLPDPIEASTAINRPENSIRQKSSSFNPPAFFKFYAILHGSQAQVDNTMYPPPALLNFV